MDAVFPVSGIETKSQHVQEPAVVIDYGETDRAAAARSSVRNGSAGRGQYNRR